MISELRLPSRLEFGSLSPELIPAWTESISRHRAVVRLRQASVSESAIHESDEIALEIDLPERRPFSPRCLRCEGRVGFVSRMIGDSIRLGMIVDRMQFRIMRSDGTNEQLFIIQAKGGRRYGGGAL